MTPNEARHHADRGDTPELVLELLQRLQRQQPARDQLAGLRDQLAATITRAQTLLDNLDGM